MLIAKHICDQLDDQEVIRKALEEVDYFSCLYERYEQRLLRYIHRLAAVSDTEAQDILQDAFIKIWKTCGPMIRACPCRAGSTASSIMRPYRPGASPGPTVRTAR